MPPPAGLPPAIAQLSFRSAFSLDAGRDFNADLNRLIQHLDSIRISKVLQNQQVGDYMMIRNCCQTVVRFLRREAETEDQFRDLWFHTYGTGNFYSPMGAGMSLFLYRIVPDSSSLAEIHLMLTTWGRDAEDQHLLAGWIIDRLQRNPVLPVDPDEHGFPPGVTLRIFPSTEDPRSVWSCVSQRPYELSLSYILRASY